VTRSGTDDDARLSIDAGSTAGGRRADREHSVEVAKDLRLHVVEWGEERGWPVVILHGGAHDASHWADVCRRLPARLRCIVPDQRGHGASDRAPDGDYSCAAQVGDLVALLSTLGIDRCALVGHSMGGLNALRFAGTWPERASALVLVDVSTETRRSGLAAVRRSSERRPPAGDPSTQTARFDRRLLDFVPTYGGDEAERRRLLEASHTPLLVVRGQKSRILSGQAASRCAKRGKGKVVAIPDAGHNVSVHNPDAVAEALWDFLGPRARVEG
jgi:pimeloyl-ACP methyl ester carboxylesterase